ncbi:hypothetical protein [Bradyrhizobium canariense]|uniref:hypothetical protein n=1 Tax=Bradyrhizobium canariense TaxID=255045 RepID=UPI0011BAB08A|nr:hypothetical protein [Bradyrhizobium canariense]
MQRLDRARGNAWEFEPVDFANLHHGADYSPKKALCECPGRTTKAAFFVNYRQKVRRHRSRATLWVRPVHAGGFSTMEGDRGSASSEQLGGLDCA